MLSPTLGPLALRRGGTDRLLGLQRATRTQSLSRWACLLVAAWLGGGCVAHWHQVDLGEPGWHVRQGQAVWRAADGAPELAGELLVAVRPGGESFVQFMKTPFPLVDAYHSASVWQIDFGSGRRVRSGQGAPPRWIWLHLADLLAGAPPPAGWTLECLKDGRWRLEHHASGEVLEGFVNAEEVR